MQASRYPTTVYLSAPDMIRLVRRKGLSACIAGVAERIEREFLRWNAFDKSARLACHSSVGVIELMPIADAEHFAFKYVNGHPLNTRRGLPTVMAFGVLADVATGAPRLLSELTLTTAIRTAAMSAVAARALARPGSRAMALIGNGVGTCDDGHQRTPGRFQGLGDCVHFGCQQRPSAGHGRKLRNAVGAGLGAVRGAKGVVHEDVAKRRHLSRQCFEIGRAHV